jgi:Tfp pilus tip-associated adhesin PilY1
MAPKLSSRGRTTTVSVLLAAALLALAGGGAVHGDDRDLLRDSIGAPYVFILFDTSGSMNWSPKCTQEQFDRRECGLLCPTGDCYTPLQADDPNSKFYQAKQALYEVLERVDNVQFGFGTYNQDGLQLRAKHWLYEAAGDGVVIPGWGAFPALGANEVFGLTWGCDTGQNDNEVGCSAGRPADLSEAWERTRVQRLSKGGLDRTATTTFYVRHAGSTYRARYQVIGGSYGSNLTVEVSVARCTNGSCSNTAAVAGSPQNVTWTVIDEFASWDNAADNNPKRTNPQLTYFDAAASDSAAGNTCAGWDPNNDTTSDRNDGYSVRWPTDTSDSRGSLLHMGDVIPLDWENDHREDILRRLAPNRAFSAATPDFGIASYFNDARSGSDDFLRLKDEAVRPLLANGSTPLGNSVRSFRTWYAGCSQGTCPRGSGWKSIASAQDPDWGCRRKFLLVITDGDETCSGADACSGTASLFSQEGIKTYVVAFGLENTSGNRLNCMAANGGSGDPIYPQNKDELVTALTDLFGQIREEASAFASAAVPSVQAEVADRIYLSSFTPLNAQSVWDGHLDAYLKPLPLTPDGKPDRNRDCSTSGGSSCHLWDAGEVLVTQAPTQADLTAASTVNAGVLKLGGAVDERRVFYAQAGFGGRVPTPLRLFSPPAGTPQTDPDWSDLWRGLKLLPEPSTATDYADRKADVEKIIKQTLVVKESTVEGLGGTTRNIDYVLGDVFHSDPVIVDRPNDFFLFTSDAYGTPSTDCSVDETGYNCYAQKHRYRRKLLLVGSNDGQLHAFDGGVWDGDKFSNGTGTELFSYIPRLGLPVVRDLATDTTRQIYGIDSTVRVDDVFLDPRHNGIPDPDEREWRTVGIGGFREGGRRDGGGFLPDFVSGYYALDITQPDRLRPDNTPVNQQVVPSCLSLDNQVVSGCGELPFPSVLWEFSDSITTSRMDEDDNGYPDLGQTWSVPTVGRIRVLEDGREADKFVAIFGGGMDAESKASPRRGNWLYMVDVETGQVIYKRRLVGAAPSDPAAIDVDLDGFLDRIYIGTTGGFLYKVDINSRGTLEDVTIPRTWALPDLAADAVVKRITDASWEPFPIFNTTGRPIYFPPTAFFVSRLDRYALAFGSGDREDLWEFNAQEGRFFLIIDDNFTSAQPPRDETDYQEIRADAADVSANSDFVLRPNASKERGWFLRLEEDERVITQAFGLSGIVIFSSFQPQVVVTGGSGSGNGNGSSGGGRNGTDAVCARGGDSRIFVVYGNNANSLMDIDGSLQRFRLVPEFVTNPYVEQGATKNPATSNGNNSEVLDATQKAIMNALKKFHPKGTKFANYWISVSGIRSDTGYERYATIPVGIMQRNWKEH